MCHCATYNTSWDMMFVRKQRYIELGEKEVMLGSGNPEFEDWMRATESTYRDKFWGWDTVQKFNPYAEGTNGEGEGIGKIGVTIKSGKANPLQQPWVLTGQ
ncbi:unnamed protein product [Lupinus luteus]|uniref:Uncharacterized protein n=1 Tax=Lupinus luteus TaxID=3873 RepID=A0AAV1W786_LUPLU